MKDIFSEDSVHRLKIEMEALATELVERLEALPVKDAIGYFLAQKMVSRILGREVSPDSDDIDRVLEYIHAVAASKSGEKEQEFSEQRAQEALALCSELIKTTMLYCLSSSEMGKDNPFGDATGRVSMSAKSNWILVRGHRFFVLEQEFFEHVLSPHDDIIREVYGIGAAELSRGIGDAINGLRGGHFDAIAEIEELIEIAEMRDLSDDEKAGGTNSIQNLFRGGITNFSTSTILPEAVLSDIAYGLGENTEFLEEGSFRGTPLRTLPARIKPLIKLDDGYYATELNFFRDSLYRALQRGLLARKPEYRQTFNVRQSVMAETAFPDLFGRHLRGAAVLNGFYYVDPDTGQMAEGDTLVWIDDVLVQMEAKAGVGAFHSPETNFDSHVRAIKNLVLAAYRQTDRFFRSLEKYPSSSIFKLVNGKYVEVGTIRLADFRCAFPIGLTVESFSPFSTMCKELPEVVPILGRYPFMSMSIDEMMVLRRMLPTAGELFHYLQVRQSLAGIALVHFWEAKPKRSCHRR